MQRVWKMDLSGDLNGKVIPKVYYQIQAYFIQKPTAKKKKPKKSRIKALRVNRENKSHEFGGEIFLGEAV